ncbi:hemolymph juvenile hormone binding protein precursor [Bombyx mori]|uniref:Hemolymph juvenile hormone binding protein n=1 Tax=Bombyx mori TaxID=7091 RepID=Q9U555_BOMMO|nr:hemolymph juvenile hormone binding protein precursor [Bombyx mori]AAF19268.1 hemolymph juvenile hormone binding protein precursor [Bombyx mori]
MASLKVFLVFVFARYVASDGDALLKPCKLGDMQCLSSATEQFLEKTSKGIPQYDIWPIDPLVVTSLDVIAPNDAGVVIRFKNLNITGLKNQQISDFQMDTKAKTVLLKTKADLHIVGDIVIELTEQSKSFTGLYTADTNVIGAVRYGYNLKNDDNGVQHFEVQPETFTCESIGEPKVTLSSDLSSALEKDSGNNSLEPDMEPLKTLRQAAICKIAEACYISVVHNIRASAKILPASSFFENLN